MTVSSASEFIGKTVERQNIESDSKCPHIRLLHRVRLCNRVLHAAALRWQECVGSFNGSCIIVILAGELLALWQCRCLPKVNQEWGARFIQQYIRGLDVTMDDAHAVVEVVKSIHEAA